MTKDQIREHFKGRYNIFYEKYLPPENKIKKMKGSEYLTNCPFPDHADTNPSFNFNADDGRYFCHGQCNAGGDIFKFYAKIKGLNGDKDFHKVINGIAGDFGIKSEEIRLRLSKAYSYRDINGKLLFQVCRYEPKDFSIRTPDGNGGYKYGLNGVKPVLYRLPEIVKASDVLVVEGEKDADNLHDVGFTATTAPMGAGKWRPEYSDCLKDKDVILIPDNDDPGREHMTEVGAALQGIAKSVKWIDLPDVPIQGDISDWIRRFQSREELQERIEIMIESAKLYAPIQESATTKTYTLADAVLEAQTFCQLEIPPRKSYLHPIVQEKCIGLWSGPKGIGKTWLGLSAADAITRCQNLGPWEAREPAACLYLDGEMAEIDIQNNLKLLNPKNERVKPLYIYSDCFANSLGISRAHLLNEKWQKEMKDLLVHLGVKVFFIDNIASLAPGIDENAKELWDPINQWLIGLRFDGITSELLHHTNKEGGQRGTSAREDNIDLSILMKHPRDYAPEKGADFIITFTKSRLPCADLKYIQDVHFTLHTDEHGKTSWIFKNVKTQIKEEVIRLLDEGYSQKEVAELLEISTGRVSQIKKEKKLNF